MKDPMLKEVLEQERMLEGYLKDRVAELMKPKPEEDPLPVVVNEDIVIVAPQRRRAGFFGFIGCCGGS